ncbi:ABC transporter substrate-binding protein [Granulicoccus phenolivorans]|uniref:ABC transporter substrate-binding protein n=1 Tax=Granulicoccus phenolivorans TaxID=266854 RepID=UPI0004122C46|nr:ABC transporter substrate-binding protein [Granulicoccus phenolivorans]
MKTKIAIAMAVLLSLFVSACGSATSGSKSGGGSGETIKIAVVSPTSGSLAKTGTDAANAWKTAARLYNEKGGVLGRKIELIQKDTDGDPSTTLQGVREAVTKGGAKFVGGVMTSPENAAVSAQAKGLGVVAMNAIGKDDVLRGKQCSPNQINVVQSNSMSFKAIEQALKDMPGQKWAIQAVDFSTGHSASEKFTEAIKASGKEVVLQQYAPQGTTDFGPYITNIKNSGADAMLAVVYGSDREVLVQQMQQFNLGSQVKTVVGSDTFVESLFPVMGDGIIGYYNNVGYDVNADNAMNKEFVQAFIADHGNQPEFIPADNYLAAQLLFGAIEKAGSTDTDKVLAALKGMKMDTIDGEVSIRPEDNQVLRNMYVGRVVKKNDKLAYEIISTTGPEVSTPQANPDCVMS